MGVNITTIVYLRFLIIEIGSTIVLMVVEAQGNISIGLVYLYEFTIEIQPFMDRYIYHTWILRPKGLLLARQIPTARP